MEQTAIFYQAEGLASVEVIEVERDTTVAALLELLVNKHRWSSEVVLFAEDIDEALDAAMLVREIETTSGTKVHAHRCRKIDVAVTFNGTTLPYEYAPSATIARIKRHVAIEGFHLSEEAAAEHVLQIKGSTTQPAPGTHLGALVHHPQCRIAFDLVPKVRVQGAYETIG